MATVTSLLWIVVRHLSEGVVRWERHFFILPFRKINLTVIVDFLRVLLLLWPWRNGHMLRQIGQLGVFHVGHRVLNHDHFYGFVATSWIGHCQVVRVWLLLVTVPPQSVQLAVALLNLFVTNEQLMLRLSELWNLIIFTDRHLLLEEVLFELSLEQSLLVNELFHLAELELELLLGQLL